MKLKFAALATFITLLFYTACKQDDTSSSVFFKTPLSGDILRSGDVLKINMDFKQSDFDSIVYKIDSIKIASKKDTAGVIYNTENLPLGNRLLTAVIYKGGTPSEITTNIVIASNTVPQLLKHTIINTYPHDTSSYTQGLEFENGIFYESDGEYGGSSLRKVEPESGKVLKMIPLNKQFFGEGLTIIDNKVLQLTWQNKIGFIYDKNSFEKTGEFPYQNSNEGWGLCNDGEKIYKSDGTNVIYFLDKNNNYREDGFIEVYDDKGPITGLNELEFINEKIYANVYESDDIVIIDPKTGKVLQKLNLYNLMPEMDKASTGYFLNGIAYDRATKRLFVTGKKWPKLFEIKISE